MKKRWVICMLAFLLAGCAAQEEGAAGLPGWEENKLDVDIYAGEFDGVYEESYLDRETGLYEGRHGKCTGDTAYLLVVDGGFVPQPELFTVREKTYYAPLETLAPMGVAAEGGRDEYGYYALLRRGEDTLRLSGQQRAEKNGEEFETEDFLIEEMDGRLYVPICFVAEQFGGTVQVVEDFRKEFCAAEDGLMKASILVVEMPQEGQEAFTPEEGLEIVREASRDEFGQAEELARERGAVPENFDPMAIRCREETFGRYYVYVLEGFESLPIFFNKYTGEVYGAQPGLPVVSIQAHFPNISWLMQ